MSFVLRTGVQYVPIQSGLSPIPITGGNHSLVAWGELGGHYFIRSEAWDHSAGRIAKRIGSQRTELYRSVHEGKLTAAEFLAWMLTDVPDATDGWLE